ncbi:hypothetical protein LCGC14_0375830 [marine sediment metagenome]|uniref:Uncharacterized protein n=1 Tax=marine sediment metagenome TaxID=412755 RepID=A0A0F9T3P5_9ZZZZ
MRTYSVAIKVKGDYWVTNWHKYDCLADINWDEVLGFCLSTNKVAYGFYYGHKSNELTSSRCRTELAYLI